MTQPRPNNPVAIPPAAQPIAPHVAYGVSRALRLQHRWRMTNRKSRITHYALRIPHSAFRITHHSPGVSPC